MRYDYIRNYASCRNCRTLIPESEMPAGCPDSSFRLLSGITRHFHFLPQTFAFAFGLYYLYRRIHFIFRRLERTFHRLECIFRQPKRTFRQPEYKTYIAVNGLLTLIYYISMDALYDFLPAPPSGADESSPRLYPRIVSKGTVTFDKLTEQIASHSGLSKGTILAVMDEIEYWAAQFLSDGYRVQIGNIGTASVSLKANTEVYDPSGVHAQSVRFGKVRLTASKKFTKQCYGKVLRAPAGQKILRNPKVYSEAERLSLLQSHLESHSFITLKAYGELTGLPKTTAWRDLDKWVKAHLIGIEGRAPHRVYVKRKG